MIESVLSESTESLLKILAANPETARFVASYPHTPPAVLQSLLFVRAANLTDGSSATLSDLAPLILANPALPVSVLERVGRNYPRYRTFVAQNPTCSAQLCQYLVDVDSFEDEGLLQAVAVHKNASPDVLHKLLENGSKEVQKRVLSNPSVSSSDLFWWAHSSPPRSYIESILQNPACPPALLSPSVFLSEVWVSETIASNPSTPEDVLLALYSAGEVTVSAVVLSNPSCPTQLLRLPDFSSELLCEYIAKNPNCPLDVLSALASHPSATVVDAAVASNRLPADVLTAVAARSTDLGVLSSVALDPSCPVSVLRSLVDDPKSFVCLTAAIYGPLTPLLSSARATYLTYPARSEEFREFQSALVAVHNQLTSQSSTVEFLDVYGKDSLFVHCSGIIEAIDGPECENFLFLSTLFAKGFDYGAANGLFTTAQLVTLKRLASERAVGLTSVGFQRSPSTRILPKQPKGSGIEIY